MKKKEAEGPGGGESMLQEQHPEMSGLLNILTWKVTLLKIKMINDSLSLSNGNKWWMWPVWIFSPVNTFTQKQPFSWITSFDLWVQVRVLQFCASFITTGWWCRTMPATSWTYQTLVWFYRHLHHICGCFNPKGPQNGFKHYSEKTAESQDDLKGRKQKLTARNTERAVDRANGGKRQSGGGGLSGQTDRKTGPPSLIPEGEEISSVCRESETLSARA